MRTVVVISISLSFPIRRRTMGELAGFGRPPFENWL